MNQAVEDELTSINAIYAAGTLSPATTQNNTEYTLRVPFRRITLRLALPDSYPTEPPIILGPGSAGSELRKGEANDIVESARKIIKRVFQTGQPCMFDLLEELQNILDDNEDSEKQSKAVGDALCNIDSDSVSAEGAARTQPLYTEPQFSVSEAVTEKKSVFVARAAKVKSPGEARFCIDYLKNTDKKAAKATHNMTAWRIRNEPFSDVVQHDCDDDGEAAAGGRLLHLLELMDAWDVVVIVSRWFGGTLLGPDRFRIINAVARDSLLSGGFAKAAQKYDKRKTQS